MYMLRDPLPRTVEERDYNGLPFSGGKFRLGIPWGEDVHVLAPNPSLLIQLDGLGLVHTKPSTLSLMCICADVKSLVLEILST